MRCGGPWPCGTKKKQRRASEGARKTEPSKSLMSLRAPSLSSWRVIHSIPRNCRQTIPTKVLQEHVRASASRAAKALESARGIKINTTGGRTYGRGFFWAGAPFHRLSSTVRAGVPAGYVFPSPEGLSCRIQEMPRVVFPSTPPFCCSPGPCWLSRYASCVVCAVTLGTRKAGC